MGSWKVGNQFCVKRSFELYQEFHNPRKSICNDDNLFSSNNRACFFFFESIWPMILLTLCHLDTFWYVASLKLFSHSLKHTVRLHCHDQANLFDIFWLLMRLWIWEFLLVWHFPMRRLFWPFHCCYSIKFLWSYFYSFVKKKMITDYWCQHNTLWRSLLWFIFFLWVDSFWLYLWKILDL